MALPNIILNAPYVLVTLSASPSGIIPQKKGEQIGYVEMVYDTSDKTAAGQYVIFNSEDSVAFLYGSTIYYRIKEENVLFRETPV
jgi:hypothetical protein